MGGKAKTRATKIRLSDLEQLRVRRPAHRGAYWKGISHARLLKALLLALEQQWDSVGEPDVFVSRHGADLTAIMEVGAPLATHGFAAAAFQPILGVNASTAQRFALTFYAGVHRRPREGLQSRLILSSFPGRRYTKTFDLTDEAIRATKNWSFAARHFGGRLRTLRNTILGVQEVESILIAAGRRSWLPWSRIGKVAAAFTGSKDDADNDQAHSALSLLHLFCIHADRSPPMKRLPTMLRFYHLLQGVCNEERRRPVPPY